MAAYIILHTHIIYIIILYITILYAYTSHYIIYIIIVAGAATGGAIAHDKAVTTYNRIPFVCTVGGIN